MATNARNEPATAEIMPKLRKTVEAVIAISPSPPRPPRFDDHTLEWDEA
jgi:hypothetical protein